MVYYKRFFLILLFVICFMFFLNSNVFAYSFIDKDGQIYETEGNPQYYESPIQIVTYYNGYYYFIVPNIPSQSDKYWYDNNGYLANNWLIDDNLEGHTPGYYCARIEDGTHLGWSGYSISSDSDILFYENLTYNTSPIYDFYGSSFIIKPAMTLENLDGMQVAVNDLVLLINSNNLFGVFNYCISFLPIVCLFVLGVVIIVYIIKRISKAK